MDDGLVNLKKDELHAKATDLGFEKPVGSTTKDELIGYIRRKDLEALAVDLGYQPDPEKATDEQLQTFIAANSPPADYAGAAEGDAEATGDGKTPPADDAAEPAGEPPAADGETPAAETPPEPTVDLDANTPPSGDERTVEVKRTVKVPVCFPASVPVVLAVDPPDVYSPRELTLKRLSAVQRDTLKRLQCGLKDSGAQTAAGKPIESAADVLEYVLDCIAAQVPA